MYPEVPFDDTIELPRPVLPATAPEEDEPLEESDGPRPCTSINGHKAMWRISLCRFCGDVMARA